MNSASDIASTPRGDAGSHPIWVMLPLPVQVKLIHGLREGGVHND